MYKMLYGRFPFEVSGINDEKKQVEELLRKISDKEEQQKLFSRDPSVKISKKLKDLLILILCSHTKNNNLNRHVTF